MNYETHRPVVPPLKVQGTAQLCALYWVLCQSTTYSPSALLKEVFYIFSLDNMYLFLPVFLQCAQGKDGYKIFLHSLHLHREAISNRSTATSALV